MFIVRLFKHLLIDQYCMPVATAIIGGAIIGGLVTSAASRQAASTQADAANNASATQMSATQQQLAQQQAMYDANVARQQPWVTSGQNANARLSAMMAPGGELTKNFSASDLQGNLAPSYQFMLNQGNQGLAASAAARGGLMTGQGAKDIAQYNQDYASTGYQQAYNNFVNNQNNQYNRLSGLSSMGENAAAGVGNQGTQVSSNMANTAMSGTAASNNALMSGAAANAAGQMGQANAWSNAYNSGANNYMTMQYLNRQPPPTAPLPATETA